MYVCMYACMIFFMDLAVFFFDFHLCEMVTAYILLHKLFTPFEKYCNICYALFIGSALMQFICQSLDLQI